MSAPAIAAVAARFCLEGAPVSCVPTGNGHINGTFTVATDAGRRYILQQINVRVFQDVPGLMRNIALVTDHLRAKLPPGQTALTPVPARDGALFLRTPEDGACFRMFDFVEGGVCLDRAESEKDFCSAGKAFGLFQRLLADFPVSSLAETIPHFHDTPHRYRLFHDALRRDGLGRASFCRREIDFALEHEKDAGVMTDMLRRGELPLRVTHNDTKLNNVILDAATREPKCVIDLDTVMPGLSGNDFGDAIRFGASAALEDERDLSKVRLSLPLYEAFARGFLSACGKTLLPAEAETLPLAARIMTLETGLRFLTDHLEGDRYFSIHRENHNLDRCRAQFELLRDMEAKRDDMERIVGSIRASL